MDARPAETLGTIRFQRPLLPPAEAIERYFARSREARWFSNDGPCLHELRGRLEAYVGGGLHVVPVASGTVGLMAALRALLPAGPRERPLVLVPSFTFVATVNAILWCGRTPAFVDVDPRSWHVAPDALDEALERHAGRVGAVLACSTFGTAPAAGTTARWERSAQRHGVPLVVDSAAGFGSAGADGTLLGGQGDAEVFSFHATKPLAIGEGGAIATRSGELAERLRRLVNFGFDDRRQVAEPLGLNGKLSEMHAAIGLAALDDLDAQLAARRERAARMRDRLAGAGYAFQRGSERSAWQFVPVLAPDAATRDAVLDRAQAAAVEVRTYHEPQHRMERVAGEAEAGPLAVTEALADRALSLPLAADMPESDAERVAAAVLGVA